MDLYEFLNSVRVPAVPERLHDMRDGLHRLAHIPVVGGGMSDMKEHAYHLSNIRRGKRFDSPQVLVSYHAHDGCMVSWTVILAGPEVLQEWSGITSTDTQFVVLGRNHRIEEPSKEQTTKDKKRNNHELAQSSRRAAEKAKAVGPCALAPVRLPPQGI